MKRNFIRQGVGYGLLLCFLIFVSCGPEPGKDSGNAASGDKGSFFTHQQSAQTSVNTKLSKTVRPALVSNSTTAAFKFSCTAGKCAYKCRLDANPWQKCKSAKTYFGLAPGAHTFKVKATNSAGQTDRTPAQYTWHITYLMSPVSAGGNHTCAMTGSGGIECWGYNANGQVGDGTTADKKAPVDVSGLASGMAAVSAGGNHSCGLNNSGGAKCWGRNNYGQLGNGLKSDTNKNPVDVTGLASGVSAISAGSSHTCALTSLAGVKCWGYNSSGQLGTGNTADSLVPVDVSGLTSGVSDVSAYGFQTCVLTTGGGVKCWGWNLYGQLGTGNTVDSLVPVDVSGLSSGVSALATTGYYACALTSLGGVKCWGYNRYGQLGNGNTADSKVPVEVSGLASGVIAIAAKGSNTCALTSTGAVKCWGYNANGQLGNGTRVDSKVPVDVSGLTSNVAAVSAGEGHSCALMNSGAIKCWGKNSYGELGNNVSQNFYVPGVVSGLTAGMAGISAGDYHTCALTSSGAVKCWGYNYLGILGNGTTADTNVPADVSGLSSGVVAISTTSEHACALNSSKGITCWGNGSNGRLGTGDTANRYVPVAVSGLASGMTVVSAAGGHSCAVTTGGAAKCWGKNWYGQLGDGSTATSNVPVNVSGLSSGVSAITGGSYHTCALVSGGVKCWGNNTYLELGDGTTAARRKTPGDVSGLTSGVSAISANGYHTCALTSGGAVKCWGQGTNGQLGNGANSNSNVPVDVSGLTSGISAISAGSAHSCALTSGGAVKCWGYNGYGNLGNGANTNSNVPVDVSGLTSGIAVLSAGYGHTCAVTSGGAAKCWGYNYYGQLGNGLFGYSTTPVDVVNFP